MFGRSLLGQTVEWRPSGDVPGGWVFVAGDEILAELTWSHEEQRVRIEAVEGNWTLAFRGIWVVRGALARAGMDEPDLRYAGGFNRGEVHTRDGRSFVLFSRWSTKLGPWTGFDDEDGVGVLRIRSRMSEGESWSEVNVSPDPAFTTCAAPLMILWGGLRILHLRRPWLGVLSAAHPLLLAGAPAPVRERTNPGQARGQT